MIPNLLEWLVISSFENPTPHSASCPCKLAFAHLPNDKQAVKRLYEIRFNIGFQKTVHKFRELISITTLDPKLPPPRHDHWVSHDLLLGSDSIKLLSKLLICICQFGWLCVAAETLCDLFDPWVRWERREKDQVGI